MQIRLATVADAEGMARVHVDSWRAAYKGIVPDEHLASLSYEQRASRWRDGLATSDGTTFVYVAQDDNGEIVGFAGGGPERNGNPNYTGELYVIYLHPDHQRKGIGRHLATTVARRLVEAGYTSMLVWVLAQNPSRGFYEALGGKYLCEKPITIGGVELPEVAYGWTDIRPLIGD